MRRSKREAWAKQFQESNEVECRAVFLGFKIKDGDKWQYVRTEELNSLMLGLNIGFGLALHMIESLTSRGGNGEVTDGDD
jgi:hypothetical protein